MSASLNSTRLAKRSTLARNAVGLALLGMLAAGIVILALLGGGAVLIALLFVPATALLAVASVYNWRIAAARSVAEDLAAQRLRGIVAGPLARGWIWWGGNGALLAVTGEEVIAVTLTVRRPRLIGRAPLATCMVEVAGAGVYEGASAKGSTRSRRGPSDLAGLGRGLHRPRAREVVNGRLLLCARGGAGDGAHPPRQGWVKLCEAL
jgi:hypothetical protein